MVMSARSVWRGEFPPVTNEEKITKLKEILKGELEEREQYLKKGMRFNTEVFQTLSGKTYAEVLEVLQPASEIPREKPQDATFTVFVNGQPVDTTSTS